MKIREIDPDGVAELRKWAQSILQAVQMFEDNDVHPSWQDDKGTVKATVRDAVDYLKTAESEVTSCLDVIEDEKL